MNDKFNTPAAVEDVVWRMRLAEQSRAEDRAVILRQFNGMPPFDEATAEENSIQVNLNDLEGVNIMSQARRQWNSAFLKPSNFFTARPDYGPGHKRAEWSHVVTSTANRLLKRNRRMIGQIRATGAQTLLYGVGPVNWENRRSVIPKPIPMGSLMIPSETEIDDWDESLSYLAIFREWTPAMLYEMTHGTKTDPGWNMPLVESQFEYLKDQMYKSPNSLAYQFMPERIAELIKQDKGYFGTDAVPTIDVWDFLYKSEDGNGWHRKIILDWATGGDISSYSKSGSRPDSRNKVNDKAGFIYSSGNRKYANNISEVIHCQFGDCSAYAPFKYNSIRGLGWMLWGVCDLQNRLHCKFNEAVFEQAMWFFATAGNQDMIRLKKANFEHMGIIPAGIKFLTPNERHIPNAPLFQMAFQRNRQLMSDNSTSYTQNYSQEQGNQARTATETMAIVNSSQALTSGILEMAYTYEAFKYREMLRRLMLKGNTDPMARKFRLCVLKEGVPEDMLDSDRWEIEPEQVLGGGNKTIQMATIGFLNSIRKNLPPYGQRMVDHMSVEAATDQPDLAQDMAPLGEDKPISQSGHDAQEATMRLLSGLPFSFPKDTIYEDYVTVWMYDLGLVIKKVFDRGGMTTPDEIAGMQNLIVHIEQALGVMANNVGDGGDRDDREKLRNYMELLAQLKNHVKAIEQRMQEAMKASALAPGNGAPQDDGKREAALIMAKTKADIAANSAAARMAQKEQQFQMAEARKDVQTMADIERAGAITRNELMTEHIKALGESEKMTAEAKKEPTE